MTRHRINIEPLPAGVVDRRAHDKGIVLVDNGDDEQGACGFSREGRTGGYRVSELHLPSTDSARGRVIRAHELLHAKYTPTRPRRAYKDFPHIVTNTVEDIYIHVCAWRLTPLAHLKRDCLSTRSDAARAARYRPRSTAWRWQ
jgi:hypothetical protein